MTSLTETQALPANVLLEMPQDAIFIERLRVDAIIGIHDFERTRLQSLYFDVTLYADLSAAGHSDQVDDTLDYQAVSEFITQFTITCQAGLLEYLAVQLVQALFEQFPRLDGVTLKIDKPSALPNVTGVGVRLTRRRSR